MAHFEEVLTRIQGEGVRVERLPHGIVLRFSAEISRRELIDSVVDLLCSEELPYKGQCFTSYDGDDIVMEILFR